MQGRNFGSFCHMEPIMNSYTDKKKVGGGWMPEDEKLCCYAKINHGDEFLPFPQRSQHLMGLMMQPPLKFFLHH